MEISRDISDHLSRQLTMIKLPYEFNIMSMSFINIVCQQVPKAGAHTAQYKKMIMMWLETFLIYLFQALSKLRKSCRKFLPNQNLIRSQSWQLYDRRPLSQRPSLYSLYFVKKLHVSTIIFGTFWKDA